jgi:hypothetical protein
MQNPPAGGDWRVRHSAEASGLGGRLGPSGRGVRSVADANVTIAAEVAPAVVARPLLGPALAVNRYAMGAGSAADDRGADSRSGQTAEEGALAAKASFGRSSGQGERCSDGQCGDGSSSKLF